MSTDTEVLVGTVELVNDPVEVTGSTDVDACRVPSQVYVEGSKQEYSIVGDGLYASMTANEAPTWLTGLIDNTVANSVASGMQDYDTLVQDVRNAVDSIDVAKNTFTTAVDVTNIADGIATSKVDTLNATYEGQFATITGITSTLASTTESLSLSINNLSSEFDGAKSDITNLQSAVANANYAAASDITSLQSVYSAQEQAISTLSTDTYASLEGVRSQFTYDALVQWGGNYYSAGFGLKATAGGTGTTADPFNSEFWINAEKFKFTNSNKTGQVSPFTIDAGGTTPNVTFNGVVSFNNISGTTDVALKSELAQSGATIIDGGNITTDSIHADSLKLNTLQVTNANISGDLYSVPYTEGVEGWKLSKNGDAEFNTASFRGTVRSGKSSFNDSTAGYWLGSDLGVSKLSLGDSSNSLKWDGSSLNISGNIGASVITGDLLNASSNGTVGPPVNLITHKSTQAFQNSSNYTLGSLHTPKSTQSNVYNKVTSEQALSTVNVAKISYTATSVGGTGATVSFYLQATADGGTTWTTIGSRTIQVYNNQSGEIDLGNVITLFGAGGIDPNTTSDSIVFRYDILTYNGDAYLTVGLGFSLLVVNI